MKWTSVLLLSTATVNPVLGAVAPRPAEVAQLQPVQQFSERDTRLVQELEKRRGGGGGGGGRGGGGSSGGSSSGGSSGGSSSGGSTGG